MAAVKLSQIQLPKNAHLGGAQRSLLEAADFEMVAYMEAGLIDVTERRTRRRHVIAFSGLVMTPEPEAIEEKKRKAG